MTPIEAIRNYVFDPQGEFIRGLEVTVLTEVGQVIKATDIDKVSDWKAWGLSLLVAAGVAAFAYVKGKLPPVPPDASKVPAQVVEPGDRPVIHPDAGPGA